MGMLMTVLGIAMLIWIVDHTFSLIHYVYMFIRWVIVGIFKMIRGIFRMIKRSVIRKKHTDFFENMEAENTV